MGTEARYELERTPIRSPFEFTAAETSGLLARLAAVTAISPALAAPELKGFVEELEARRRTCAAPGCGKTFLQRKRFWGRPRVFCCDDCRNLFHRTGKRKQGALAFKP